MDFPLDPNEALRLKTLEALEVEKRIPDATVDRITAFAREHFQVPICLVTVVESECVLMLSKQGLEADQAPRNVAFCSHTITSAEVLVVPDTKKDMRFKTNPLVTQPPCIRFYAGAPLTYEGEIRLGSLCLMDTKPRSFSRGEKAELVMLAEYVVAVIIARALNLPEPDLGTALSI